MYSAAQMTNASVIAVDDIVLCCGLPTIDVDMHGVCSLPDGDSDRLIKDLIAILAKSFQDASGTCTGYVLHHCQWQLQVNIIRVVRLTMPVVH